VEKWRSQDWLVPEIKEEIEKHFPRPENINKSGQVGISHLANAAAKVFYKGKHFYNIYQVYQTVLMFGAQWGFHIKIHSSWHVHCSCSATHHSEKYLPVSPNRQHQRSASLTLTMNCPWIICCAPLYSPSERKNKPLRTKTPVKLTATNFSHTCEPGVQSQIVARKT
jgi:hypothetical protein